MRHGVVVWSLNMKYLTVWQTDKGRLQEEIRVLFDKVLFLQSDRSIRLICWSFPQALQPVMDTL